MDEFDARLYTMVSRTLEWRWPDIKISLIYHEGGPRPDFGQAFRPFHDCVERERVFVDVLIFLSEKYIKENENWHENSSPIGLACSHMLRAVGLTVATTDAIIDPNKKCYRFWVEKNERVFKFLPPIEELRQSEYYNFKTPS